MKGNHFNIILISQNLIFYYYFPNKMRFAIQRTSPQRTPIKSKQISVSPSKIHRQNESQKMYMHYNNAIYMGGMVSYKRNGNGILLLDDGTSIISQYCFDTLTGHNVIYRENAVISILFLKNSVYQVVIRTGYYIAKIPFYDKEHLPHGTGVFIDFQRMKIYHIFFESGKIERKIVESNKNIIQRVMNQQINVLIDQRHQNALKFNMKYDNGIKFLKEGKKITIGFIDNRHYLQGIGFKIKINENSFDDFRNPLSLKFIERGFYIKNRLQNFGQRYFSNGNVYIGQLKDDLFNGEGLLLYPHEQKWVYGIFHQDKLIKMLNINLPQNDNTKPQSVKTCLRSIHEFNNVKNWINSEIQIFQWKVLTNVISGIIEAKITDVAVEKQRIMKEQQERLIRIQEHFRNEEQSNKIDKVMKEQINKNIVLSQKVVINDYSSQKPKVIQIQPRNIENEDYWSHSFPSKINVLTPNIRTNNPQSKINASNYLSQAQKSVSPSKKMSFTRHSPTKRFNYRLNI